MVRVAVAADRVEGQNDLRFQLTDIADHIGGNLVQGLGRQGLRMLVIGRAGHARITVIEKVDAFQPQDPGGAAQFGLS